MEGKVGAALVVALAVFAAVPSSALELSDLDINPGLLLIFSANEGLSQSAPSPAITQSIGASLPVDIGAPFFAQAGIDFFGYDYRYYPEVGRAVPVSVEAASAFFTLASIVSLQAGVRFPVAKALVLGGTLGLDFLLRFPLYAYDAATDRNAGAGMQAGLDYFFSSTRFFYPETRIFLRWQAVEMLALVFSVRALYPVFHAWDAEGQPFWDQLIVAGTLGFSIRLWKPQKQDAASK